jgi:homoserine kinase type II
VAVFTAVTEADASALLEQFELGSFVALRGIASGIENSNYFLTTTRGEYVLTLFERLTAEQLPFYLNLTSHLAAFGLPVPGPKVDRKGRSLFELNGKPGAIVSKLIGQPELVPNVAQCAELGAALARMHTAAMSYEGTQPNLRGLAWWQATVPQVLRFLSEEQYGLITRELAAQTALADTPQHQRLPQAAIHADLFRDNAMFHEGHLSGIFDFYFAGVDTLLFDVAVCLNDWCIERPSGLLKIPEAKALLAAYQTHRAFSDDERALLPDLLCAAALRFWVSRLFDYFLPREASVLTAHDPTHFERVLIERRLRPVELL